MVNNSKLNKPLNIESLDTKNAAYETVIQAKADEVITAGIAFTPGGKFGPSRESVVQLIRDKGIEAANKSIAGFKDQIAQTKKISSYRDKALASSTQGASIGASPVNHPTELTIESSIRPRGG